MCSWRTTGQRCCLPQLSLLLHWSLLIVSHHQHSTIGVLKQPEDTQQAAVARLQ
jgi:hypothetical protein